MPSLTIAASDGECLAPGAHPFEAVVVICSSEQRVHTQEIVPAFAESKCANRTAPARSCHLRCPYMLHPTAPLLLRGTIIVPKG